jgi:hypothetical protein
MLMKSLDFSAMLNPALISRFATIRSAYQLADPFPHVSIDNFFNSEDVEMLLKEFPPFSKERAKNESGEVGPKCVVSDIRSISSGYQRLFDYMASQPFLAAVSEMTGIPDLKFDPNMYGGGTHENVSGAELDPHIDFNYDSRSGNHRRLNLLLYLNKDWSMDWGGAIELHSNPFGWIDDTNKVKTFNCDFNRCVIFETSERSWHGFRTVAIPPEKYGLTRKLISIYLYTETRPPEEIAPPHGTFYVPFPPPTSIRPGHVVTQAEYNEMRRVIRKRDALLLAAFDAEKRQSDQHQKLVQHYQELKTRIQPTVAGYALLKPGSVRDFYGDGWVAGNLEMALSPLKPITSLEVRGWLHEDQFRQVEVSAFGTTVSKRVGGGSFVISVSASAPVTEDFMLNVRTSIQKFPGATDDRKLGFIYQSVIAHE